MNNQLMIQFYFFDETNKVVLRKIVPQETVQRAHEEYKRAADLLGLTVHPVCCGGALKG